jgi:RNA recognition motif-containing protein
VQGLGQRGPTRAAARLVIRAREGKHWDMKIYVGNMPFSMDEGQLRSLFAEFGEVESANIITDRETGRPRGFAFVEMQDDDALKAIEGLENHTVEGRTLNVNKARPRENRNRGGGGGGNRW